MGRIIKVGVLLLLLILPSLHARADGELLFRIAPTKWPVPLDEPVIFNAFVLNQSDHDIRIPTDLQSFVFPKAFDLINKVEPIYGIALGPPTKDTDSVRLAPGSYYGCTLEHGKQLGGHYEFWFVLSVQKSDANPNLWSGSVVSNRQFMPPAFEKRDPK